MAKNKISDYSSTANSNTDIASINIDENCAPSGINNAIRALMAQLKDFQTGAASDPVTVGGVLTVTGGSASAPAITTSGDTNTGVLFPAADTVGIATGGTERGRVDSSGNFGLGVTPSAWSTGKAFEIGGVGRGLFSDGVNDLNIVSNAYYNGGWKYAANGYANEFTSGNGAGTFTWRQAASGTAGNAISWTTAMTLDASGNLLVGTTSATSTGLNNGGVVLQPTYQQISVGATSGTAVYLYTKGGGGAVVQAGTITVSTNTAAYNSGSDYRLKDQIEPLNNALQTVSLLKPSKWLWKSNGEYGNGFIAHELAEVCPQAVSGEKDAVNADGEPVYQGVDTSFLVATLTAAIQELKAEFDAYKATHP